MSQLCTGGCTPNPALCTAQELGPPEFPKMFFWGVWDREVGVQWRMLREVGAGTTPEGPSEGGDSDITVGFLQRDLRGDCGSGCSRGCGMGA